MRVPKFLTCESSSVSDPEPQTTAVFLYLLGSSTSPPLQMIVARVRQHMRHTAGGKLSPLAGVFSKDADSDDSVIA